MNPAQDEIRRLMKAATQKPSVATLGQKTVNIDGNTVLIKSGSSTASHVKPAIPVGFYDDALADAKARKVDVKKLAEKQLESEWKAFQQFAAEIEEQSVNEEKQQLEETKEREAVEKLENMQYIDRYRVALERVTSHRNSKNILKTTKRKVGTKSEDVGSQGSDVESHSAVQARLNDKNSKRRRKQLLESEDSYDEFDPCNWRSRGI